MLNNENYFDNEFAIRYFGASQFKDFMKCEAGAVAKLRGECPEPEPTTALLVGSYVDAYFEGTLDSFKQNNPQIFTKAGELKSDYKQAEYIIERVNRDPLFMQYMRGESQVIKTGKLYGHDFKIKMDSYHPGKCIVDLKVMRDLKSVWTEEGKQHFIDAWLYYIQAAIYQAVEGNNLPFYIAAVTKEKEPDMRLYRVPQHRIDAGLSVVKAYIDRFAEVKTGKAEPVRCESCDYCKRTKIIEEIIDYTEEWI